MLDWELPQIILYAMLLFMIGGIVFESTGAESGRSSRSPGKAVKIRAELM